MEPVKFVPVTIADYVKSRFLLKSLEYSDSFFSGNLKSFAESIKYYYFTKGQINIKELEKLNNTYSFIKKAYLQSHRALYVRNHLAGSIKRVI
jgi:hypothetical protein